MIYDELKYFTRKEMECSHCGMENMSHEFLRRLDFVRTMYGKPLVVTSGYRCEEHDMAIGGKGNHPTGEAADMVVSEGAELLEFINSCHAAGIKRYVLYPGKNYVHIDMTDKPIGVWFG